MTSNRDDTEATVTESDAPAPPLPEDMAGRSGLRAFVERDDEFLLERPEELLARLARATRLCAIWQGPVFPEHPFLRAQWNPKLERYVNGRTGKPADCISIRDRKVLYLHRDGEAEPTGVVPFRKPDDMVSLLHSLEQLEQFRGLTGVRVAQFDLDQLISTVQELGARFEELRSTGPYLRVVPPPDEDLEEVGRPVQAAPPEAPRASEEQPTVVAPVLPSSRETVVPPEVEAPAVGAKPPVHLRDRILQVLDLERRDLGSLGWLSLAAVVSLYTTWHGAKAIGLRTEIATIGTLFVVGYLWTLLADLAMVHDPMRKRTATYLFAAIAVFCGFFTYYEGQTAGEREAVATERAERVHLQLVGELYGTRKAEVESLEREAAELDRLTTEEAARGKTTGRPGYGPEAKKLAALAASKRLELADAAGQLAPLEQLVGTATTGLTPDEVHALDMRIWSAAAWRGPVPPDRGAYVDLEAPSSPITLPVTAIMAGEPEAYVALVAAAAVEGIMILCGGAITLRKRERLIPQVVRSTTRIARELQHGRESWTTARSEKAQPKYLHPTDEV